VFAVAVFAVAVFAVAMIAVAVLTVAVLTVAVLTVAVLISGVRTCITCRKEPWLPFGPTKVSSGQHRWHPGPLCPNRTSFTTDCKTVFRLAAASRAGWMRG
jgi:hypothetical protein